MRTNTANRSSLCLQRLCSSCKGHSETSPCSSTNAVCGAMQLIDPAPTSTVIANDHDRYFLPGLSYLLPECHNGMIGNAQQSQIAGSLLAIAAAEPRFIQCCDLRLHGTWNNMSWPQRSSGACVSPHMLAHAARSHMWVRCSQLPGVFNHHCSAELRWASAYGMNTHPFCSPASALSVRHPPGALTPQPW